MTVIASSVAPALSPPSAGAATGMTLAACPRHRDVMVEQVGGERSFRRRLMEMGLVPGTTVRVVAVAPMGDPLTLELRHGRLSIRKREAAEVSVRP